MFNLPTAFEGTHTDQSCAKMNGVDEAIYVKTMTTYKIK